MFLGELSQRSWVSETGNRSHFHCVKIQACPPCHCKVCLHVLSGCHPHEILGCVSKCTLFSFLDLLLVCGEKVAGFHLRPGKSNHWNLQVKRNVSANNSQCFSLISFQMADRPLRKWIRLVNAGRLFYRLSYCKSQRKL